MGTLIYPANVSVDGFTEALDGAFDWAPPDEDVFLDITGLMRSAGTYLYGRRMYVTMAVWETDPTLAERSEAMAEFARAWSAAEKVVYSTTLDAPPTARTTIERGFDPDAIARLKAATTEPVVIGGPHLAAQALAAGLVDEISLYVWPIVLGGRNPALDADRRVDLELVEQRRVGGGVVNLRYRVAANAPTAP